MSSVRSRPSRRQLARPPSDLTVKSSHGDVDAGADDPSSRDLSVSRVAGRLEKISSIQKCLESDPVDITSLRQLAISRGGLINDELRRKVWPELLGVDVSSIPPKPDQSVLIAHRDYNQVVLDVNRSLKRFPPGMEEEKRLGLQDQLVDVIMRILVNHNELHYYQGYHDICVTFLLVVGEDLTFALVDQLSTNHLRDFMDVNMERTNHILNYLYPIVEQASPKLCEFMERSEVGTIFCLSWLITWYGHVLTEFRHIVRLYDFFIACHPLMPIYLCAAIVLYRESEILSSECEMCVLHCLLSKIPENLPFEQLISKAGDLYLQYPPTDLANQALIKFKNRNLSKLEKNNQLSSSPVKLLKKPGQKALQVASADQSQGGSVLVKVTVWTLTAALSAAVWAVWNSAADWGWY
ncbi:TBC1 domain family member 20-like [Liolophura sinensis]|uniref:TBC1 domain family member 20-like n=1 Tax=Liolophura sinensis TaxID=3198878 RepID=UPI0031598866